MPLARAIYAVEYPHCSASVDAFFASF